MAHLINVQNVYELYQAQEIGMDEAPILRPPYPECILAHSPLDGMLWVNVVNWIDGTVKMDLYSVTGSESEVRSVAYMDVPERITGDVQIIRALNPEYTHLENWDLLVDQTFGVGMMALHLMNCKNIEYVPYDPNKTLSRQIRRHRERQNKAPFAEYKTIAISPIRKQAEATPQAAEDRQRQRLHTVRGHFKTYTAEKPLFGKLTGTYWWWDSLKGSADQGVIEHDYDLFIDSDILEALAAREE